MDYNSTLAVLTDAGTLIGEIVLIIMALMQAVKQFKIPKRFLPIIAIVLAIVVAILFVGFSKVTVLIGLVAGLTSMGLFTGGKTTIKG